MNQGSLDFDDSDKVERTATEHDFPEKRVAPRRGLQVSALLWIGDEAQTPARTVDISSSGISLIVPQTIPSGHTCQITFELAIDGHVHRVDAVAQVTQRVVGASGIRIGFQFKRLNMASLIAISRYLA